MQLYSLLIKNTPNTMKKLLVVLLLIFMGQTLEAQNTSQKDAAMLEAIYKESLLNGNS